MRDLNKFKGCLIGGAVGDALGYAVEFLDIGQIRSRYGERGITEYELVDGEAQISDDTQMTLFTANGLLLYITRGKTNGFLAPCSSFVDIAYNEWLETQSGAAPVFGEHRHSWLTNIAKLYSSRAPGNTCVSAIRDGRARGTIKKPINNSKGCGGVMRVAPVGLYFDNRYENGMQIEDIDMLGAEIAALTHGHELGYIPAAALVHIIHRIVYGDYHSENDLIDIIEDAMTTMRRLFPQSTHIEELISLLLKAIALSRSSMNDFTAISSLGEGWVAEETLAIAVYCSLKYKNNFEKAIVAAVNHSGDSDSTGAVTGNILGAYLGYDSIPDKFLEKLELKNVILEIAGDLRDFCKVDGYEMRDEVWEHKYIYHDFTM